MGKNVGLTYVKDFSFPAEQGFTGSAGVHKVRGYMRGGRVKKCPVGKGGAHQKMPANVKAKGGVVKKQLGGYMGPEREIAVDDVTISVPKMKGGTVHDKLKKEGGKMGYAYGGQVKDTSGEFKAKRGKQDTMDDGVQPARRGRTQQEIEAGGTKRLKPGLKKGGKVHRVRYAEGGEAKLKRMREAQAAKKRYTEGEQDDSTLRDQLRKADSIISRIRELKGTASDRDVRMLRGMASGLGKNREANARILSKMSEAAGLEVHKAKGGLARAAGDKHTHPKGRGRKPYTGYNEQPGGSKVEDARYMKGKK